MPDTRSNKDKDSPSQERMKAVKATLEKRPSSKSEPVLPAARTSPTPTPTQVKQNAIKVKSAIEQFFRKHKLPKDTEYVVASGIALYFHGTSRKTINDIDILVPNLPKQAGQKVAHIEDNIGGFEVDAWSEWVGGKSASESMMTNKVMKYGLPLVSMKDAHANKEILLRQRKKDTDKFDFIDTGWNEAKLREYIEKVLIHETVWKT